MPLSEALADRDRVLRAFLDDVAMLPRYLVDEGFVARDHGVYWRTGGTGGTGGTGD